MADTNPFPRTVASITREGRGPQTHAYDAPDIGPLEFLHAVYRDPSLPMSTRIDAARGLLPYTEPRPASVPSSHIGCTIVIGGLGPCATDPEPRSPADPTRNHSQNPDPASITVTHDGDPGDPVNIETTPHPDFVPDYSTPPTPAELQEIKAAINALRPDLAHLPVPEFHLCPCGHWITGEYDCCRRELSKLN
jgi:hypothetical protein